MHFESQSNQRTLIRMCHRRELHNKINRLHKKCLAKPVSFILGLRNTCSKAFISSEKELFARGFIKSLLEAQSFLEQVNFLPVNFRKKIKRKVTSSVAACVLSPPFLKLKT